MYSTLLVILFGIILNFPIIYDIYTFYSQIWFYLFGASFLILNPPKCKKNSNFKSPEFYFPLHPS